MCLFKIHVFEVGAFNISHLHYTLTIKKKKNLIVRLLYYKLYLGPHGDYTVHGILQARILE